MDGSSNSALNKIGQLIETISQIKNAADIYPCVAEFIPTVLSADHVTITHYSSKERSIVVQAVYDENPAELSIEDGQVFSTNKSYEAFADSVATPIIYKPTDNLDRDINRLLNAAGYISVLIVPIISRLKIVGTINIASKSCEYTRNDKFTLEQICALLAVATSHDEVFKSQKRIDRRRRYTHHLETLNELSESLLLANSTEDALALVASCSTELVGAKRVSYCQLDDDSNSITIVALVDNSTDMPGTQVLLEDSGLATSLVHRKHFYATDLANSPIKAHRSLAAAGNKHVWSYPIFSKDNYKRCLNFIAPDTELHMEDALSVLDTLARLLNSTLERIAAQQETIRQAKSDPLTGLCNRIEFNDRLDLAIKNTETENSTCIFYIDLDLFKNVNDTMGHLVGDQVLIKIANRIEEHLTPADTLARIGGDEFMVLLTELHDREPIEQLAEKIINFISEPLDIESQEITISASVGICQYPNHGATSEELTKNADIAMYKAKDVGRNQFYVFTEELAAELSYRLQLQKDLARAIEEDQFSLVYQPQMDIQSAQADCLEVLIRWQHPTLGWVRPDIFIPIAEQCGLIGSITDWVLKHALIEIDSIEHIHPDIRLAINVSAVEFSPQHNLLKRLKRAISEAAVDPARLEIELTETAFLKHAEHAQMLARELTDLGISIAIDDFGTGYASMSYLVQLPISCIKIDMSFVDDVENDIRKQAIIKGIIAISNGLKLTCLAEGVETVEQLRWLAKAGCDSAQGYLFSKPVPINALPDALAVLSQLAKRAA